MEGEERDSTGWSGKLSKEVTCELRPEGHEDLTEGIPRRINSKCKSPGAGMSLTHLGNDTQSHVSRDEPHPFEGKLQAPLNPSPPRAEQTSKLGR